MKPKRSIVIDGIRIPFPPKLHRQTAVSLSKKKSRSKTRKTRKSGYRRQRSKRRN